jgi:hypothetical protein
VPGDLDEQFGNMGASTVRARLGDWTGYQKAAAIAWLGRQDEQERLRDEASQASQTRTALSTRRASWIAAIAAIIAAIASLIELVKR